MKERNIKNCILKRIREPLCHLLCLSGQFPEKPLKGLRVEVKDKTVTVPCEGLPKGTYALALFQNLNGNGTLGTGAYGIPH